jgi:hypothetical protein
MPRRKTGRRRGRPRLANARRRATTRRGRKGLPPLVDEGSPLLRQKKRRVTGREDLELNPASVLFGRGLLDPQQYNMLGQVTLWLQRLSRNLGPHGIGVAGLWAALTGAGIGTTSVIVPTGISDGADNARRVRRPHAPPDTGLERGKPAVYFSNKVGEIKRLIRPEHRQRVADAALAGDFPFHSHWRPVLSLAGTKLSCLPEIRRRGFRRRPTAPPRIPPGRPEFVVCPLMCQI